MQTGNKTFVVLGTAHDFQEPECVSKFAKFVEELCRRYKVDFIAEEANGAECTHAKIVASSVNARWANVDITQKERDSKGLECTSVGSLSPDEEFAVDSMFCADTVLNSKKLCFSWMEERERVWVARAEGSTVKSCLLICGVVHTLSVSSKFASAGHAVFPHYYMPDFEFKRTQKREVVIGRVPMNQDECTRIANELHAMTVEEVWEITLRMPSNADEYTESLSNGNILTLRRA
jgi:hypothetical protein